MRLNTREDNSALITALVIVVLATVGILAMTWAAIGADNNVPCLTKEQARQKYPGHYLYWRTAAHCWYGRPKPGRGDPTPRAQSRSVRPDVKVVRWNEFNELDAQADRDTYFESEPVPIWRLAPIPHPTFEPWDKRIGM